MTQRDESEKHEDPRPRPEPTPDTPEAELPEIDWSPAQLLAWWGKA